MNLPRSWEQPEAPKSVFQKPPPPPGFEATEGHAGPEAD